MHPIMLIFSAFLGCFAINPTVSRQGNKWKLAVTGLLAAGAITIATVNHVTTVTQSGNGSGTVTIPTGTIIPPGSTAVGSWSATSAPGHQGNSGDFGYNDNAIARWDVVPYQTFSSNFNVGVIAFHNSGIAKVSFSINNGTWTDITTASANPQTINSWGVGASTDVSGKGAYSSGIVEFWGLVLASDFSGDVPMEVRAIVYPVTGVPVVLSGLYLNANAGGSLSKTPVYVDSVSGNDSTGDGTSGKPYQTIVKGIQAKGSSDADNLVVYLQAGNYTLGDTAFPHPNLTNGFITVTTAPAVARSSVVITGKTSGSSVIRARVHYQNLTFQPATDADLTSLFNGVSDSMVWLEGCNLVGPNINSPGNWESVTMYVTDCSISNCKEGIVGTIVRNVTVDNVGQGGGQAASNFLLANYSVTNTKSERNVPTKPITAGTRSGATVTVTCTGHGLQTDMWVRVEGCTPSGYNVLPDDTTNPHQGQVTVIDANTFSYNVPADPGGSLTVGGTMQRENTFHAHGFQMFNNGSQTGNAIIDGMYFTSGGDTGGGIGYLNGDEPSVDVALVNISMNNILTPNATQVFAPKSQSVNYYMKNCDWTGSCLWRDDLGFTATDFVVESCTFPTMSGGKPHANDTTTNMPGVTFR